MKEMGLSSLIVSLAFLTACSALNSWEIPEGNLLDYITPELTADWLKFKKEYNRSFDDSYEELKRRYIWEDGRRLIDEHNKQYQNGEYTYTLGENDFADLTEDEFRKYYLNGLILPNDAEDGDLHYEQETVVDDSDLSAEWNWRTKGKVTPVRNQGRCGSCWAFSAVGAMESAYMIKHGRQVDMSEQQLVDCAGRQWGNFGCGGGWMQNAYRYIKWFRGINSERCYPYAGYQRGCHARTSCNAGSLRGYGQVTPKGSESAMQKAIVKEGPLAIAVDVSGSRFMRYNSGVFNNPYCSQTPNHAMVAVGYGSEGWSGDYWLIKNSWGTRWGDQGYIKMSRNKRNQCAIASYAWYPQVN